eukprot:TRINITY_DN14455_c0_g1_i2.p1 TRINITY_DN14455_c0_g1~~TRINITY_DN14455_c0_g1_i2.p1  ORF type:complete len:390 (-),score=48.71 TRINITY_DN14455_c0_g1_i2:173-1342(-)
MSTWRCCRGEIFVNLPGLGLVYCPQSLEILANAPAVLLFVGMFILMYCAAYVVLLCLRSHRRLSRLLRNAVALVTAAVAVPYLLSRWDVVECLYKLAGRGRFIDLPEIIKSEAEQTVQWGLQPASSPLSSLGGPVSNFRVWAPEKADAIASRVMAYRETNWTHQLGLGGGFGIFLLGVKYGGAVQNGRVLNFDGALQASESLWAAFSDVYEDLRSKAEVLLHAPARLSTALWPPAFIAHMPSIIYTHADAFDLHTDDILPLDLRNVVVDDLRKRPGWSDAECNFEHQMSLLVNLAAPPGGAGLTYYSWASNCSSDDRSPECFKVVKAEHALGSAIIVESGRLHRLGPWAREAVGTLAPRIVLHAFVVPCWPKEVGQGELEYQVLGTLGR